MLDSEAALVALCRVADISDAVAKIARERTPLSIAEKQHAADRKRSLFADPDFVRSYLSGNRAARTQVAIIGIIAAAPVADARG